MIPAACPDLLTGLREDLGLRRIGSGQSRLDEYWAGGRRLAADDPEAASILCYVAQWVDAGWRDIDVVQEGLRNFPHGHRAHLPLVDFVHVLMAEGMVWVHEELVQRALENFRLVLSLKAEIADPQLLSLAHFWTSRCHRKAGEYDVALSHAGEGYRFASAAGMEPMAAAMRVAESWLL